MVSENFVNICSNDAPNHYLNQCLFIINDEGSHVLTNFVAMIRRQSLLNYFPRNYCVIMWTWPKLIGDNSGGQGSKWKVMGMN